MPYVVHREGAPQVGWGAGPVGRCYVEEPQTAPPPR